jgi:hypothetical protein
LEVLLLSESIITNSIVVEKHYLWALAEKLANSLNITAVTRILSKEMGIQEEDAKLMLNSFLSFLRVFYPDTGSISEIPVTKVTK